MSKHKAPAEAPAAAVEAVEAPAIKTVRMVDAAGKVYDIHPDEVANSAHLTPAAE
jgi:hypothetical protein